MRLTGAELGSGGHVGLHRLEDHVDLVEALVEVLHLDVVLGVGSQSVVVMGGMDKNNRCHHITN